MNMYSLNVFTMQRYTILSKIYELIFSKCIHDAKKKEAFFHIF